MSWRRGAGVFALIGVVAVLGIMLFSQAGRASDVTTSDKRAVEQAVEQWISVLNAMLNGDPAPFSDLYSHADDAYYMGAEGTYRLGWEAIWADWQAQAAKSTGGKVEAVEVHVVVFGETAMAAHITRGGVRKPDGGIDQNNVRETSVFRLEDGQWRMIGHHADGLPYWEKAFDDQ